MTSSFLHTPLDKTTVSERLVDSLRKEILFGRIPSGERLPAERDLANQLGVNRLTLRAALARLQALGLIVVRHGTGTIVANWRETAGPESLAFLLRAGDPFDPTWRGYLEDLLEIRRFLAVEALALACVRHTPEDLDSIRRAVEVARETLQSSLQFAHCDFDIARSVVRAAHNFGLELLLNSMAGFPDAQPQVALALYPNPELHMAHHDAVISLIGSGDAEAARAFVRPALEAHDRAALQRLDALVANPK
jgi:DNA-binding FadR family transcriptional regulator